jgi:rSAM/selenodomain-associated transferase 2
VISIIIPALDEAGSINNTLEGVFAQGGNYEVIVVDGDPGGSTIKAIERGGVKKAVSERGRARQMNAGTAHARGDIFLFLHADTLLPRRALSAVLSAMKDQNVAGGAFCLGIRSGRPVYRAIELGAALRTRLFRIPYGDQAIFLRRRCFEAFGGFKEIPIMEDLDLMRRLKRAGNDIRILPDRVSTSPRRWEKEGVVRSTLRNWALAGLFLMGVSPERLAAYYR